MNRPGTLKLYGEKAEGLLGLHIALSDILMGPIGPCLCTINNLKSPRVPDLEVIIVSPYFTFALIRSK